MWHRAGNDWATFVTIIHLPPFSAVRSLPNSYSTPGVSYGSSYNFHEQIQLDEFNILLLHGTQLRPRGNIEQLWEILTKIGGDVAVHGHTHQMAVDLYKAKLFLNPGTISGATGGWGGRTDASFIELVVKKNEMKVSLHQTDWTVSKVSDILFLKQDDTITRQS